MNDITFKVTPKGEGKTKWLISVAKRCYDEGTDVYLYTEDDRDYVKFCDKYFNTYATICPVKLLKAFCEIKNAVILVDDLMKCTSQIGEFKFMQRNCKKMFITLEGTTEDPFAEVNSDSNFEQLSIFDKGVN